MNKATILATSTLSILAMQFCVFKSKPAIAQAYNESAETKLAQGASSDDENGDTVQDELEKEAPYNDSADTELFYEEGASADDESTSNETNNSDINSSDTDSSDINSSENGDTVQNELEKEAPYNDSADTELFYEEGASADDKADSKINRDRTKSDEKTGSDDMEVDRELETDDENVNPPRGLNSEDIKVDRELETEAGTFEQNSPEQPETENVRTDTDEDIPAESPLNEAYM